MSEVAAGVARSIATTACAARSEFDAHMAESGTLAFRVAFSVLRRREDAEDIAQEAFIRAHARFAFLRDRTRFRAWLVRIAWRLAVDQLRADGRRSAHTLTFADSGRQEAGAEKELIARQRAARLWAAIDGLPQRLRLPLLLANMEGHSLGEVAALLSVPPGTVKSRLFEARRRLRETLDD